MSRAIVEQISCDHCQKVESRPLVRPGVVPRGRAEAQGGLPPDWIGMILRVHTGGTAQATSRVSRIYCGRTCAILALQSPDPEAPLLNQEALKGLKR